MNKTNVLRQSPLAASVHEVQDNTNASIKTYEEIKEHYEKTQCWGLLTSLDIKQCDGDLIRSADAIKDYVIQLCDLIDMKRFQDTVVVHFGEDEKVAGYSMVQLIETSLISGHFANLNNAVYIDIFSCKIYDPYQAAEFTKHFFKGADAAINICFRK
jgi:S-adenosylmethionine/arginine decarboxylase-like enzyme